MFISQSQLEEEWMKKAERYKERQGQSTVQSANFAMSDDSQLLAKQHQQLQSTGGSVRQAPAGMKASHEQWKLNSSTPPVSLAQIQAEEARRMAEEQVQY